MNLRNALFSFTFLLFLTTSCTKILLKRTGMVGGKPKIQKIDVKGKDVLFLGMIHLSQQGYYTKSKIIIDSLSNQGYFILGEATRDSSTSNMSRKSLNEFQDDQVLKKLRKLSGLQMSKSSLSLIGKIVKKYDIKPQPKDLYAFNDTTKAMIADNSLLEQIREYEKVKGELRLDSCDIASKIGDDYNCNSISDENVKYFKEEIIKNGRNKLVIDAVKKSSRKKILIIYGKNHFEGIKKGLEN